MANKSAVLSVRIVTDTKAGEKGLKNYRSALDRFEGGVNKLALPAAGVLAGLGAAAKSAYDLAAAAEQNVGAVQTVFKGAAADVLKWSEGAADAAGMSSSAYNELAAQIGGSLAKAGYAQDEMAGKTRDLIAAGADLSSVFGGTAAEAAQAMGAGLRGEFDSLERFGVFLNMSAVNAELAARGQDKLTGSALDAAKKQATTALILEQAGAYAGNFAREADTAAGAQQRAAAAAQDAAAELGTALIPVVVAASRALAGFAGYVKENPEAVRILVVAVAALAAGVLGIAAAFKVFQAVQIAATAAQWLFNAAMAANPIGLLVLAIIGLIALVVMMYNKFAWFRDGVDAAVKWISDAFNGFISWVAGAWAGVFGNLGAAAKAQFDIVVGAIQTVIGWVQTALGFLRDLFGQQSSAAGAQAGFSGAGYMRPAYDVPVDGAPFYITAAEPALRLPALVGGRGGAAVVEHHYHYDIDVTGAVDRLATARELRKLLAQLERSEGKRAGAY